MPYIIICRDKPDSHQLRADTRPTHLAYLDRHEAKLLAGGALLSDDATSADGSVLIYDTEDRAEAEAFSAGDPFTQAGLFQSVEIRRWRKGYLAGKKQG